MKKKHKHLKEPENKNSNKDLFKLFDPAFYRRIVKKNKTMLLIFLASFLLSAILLSVTSNQDPIPNGSDPYYYYVSAQKVKEHIIKSPVAFIFKTIFNSYSQNDYINMGFTENDIESVYRAPAFIFIWAILFTFFGQSHFIIFFFNALFFA
ncbi:MAG: hypothetical protein KKH98_11420, partial [Spirochaetes bacterium]|nr:hypothetical protein [Spirochaetota bacterium]